MIRRIWRVLPGALWMRIGQAVLLTAVFLVVLHLFYSWLGILLLDQGGTVG